MTHFSSGFEQVRLPPRPDEGSQRHVFSSFHDFMSWEKSPIDLPRLNVGKDTRAFYFLWEHVEEKVPHLLQRIEHAIGLLQPQVQTVTLLEETVGDREGKVFHEAVLNDYLCEAGTRDFHEWTSQLTENKALEYMRLLSPDEDLDSKRPEKVAFFLRELGNDFSSTQIQLSSGLARIANERRIKFVYRQIDIDHPLEVEESDNAEEIANRKTAVYQRILRRTVGEFPSAEDLMRLLCRLMRSQIEAVAKVVSAVRNFSMMLSSEYFVREANAAKPVFVLCGASHAAVPYAHLLNPRAPIAGLEFVVLPESFLAAAPTGMRQTFPLQLGERIAAEYSQYPSMIRREIGDEELEKAIMQECLKDLLYFLALRHRDEFPADQQFFINDRVCGLFARTLCELLPPSERDQRVAFIDTMLAERPELTIGACFRFWCAGILQVEFPGHQPVPDLFRAIMDRYFRA